MTLSIGMAFRRRERALFHIARIRAATFQIYLAHAVWTNWEGGKGRTNAGKRSSATYGRGRDKEAFDWLQHSDTVMEQIVGLGDELSRFLSMPTSSRSYHRMLKSGRQEAADIVELQYRLFDSLYTKRITNLTMMVETLKEVGLSTTECSRVRHFERDIGEAVEGLRMIKMYRTPQALRSFGRLFTVLLPPLYAASFSQLAFDLYSLPMGIIFAIITPLCLTALYESMTNLEDPFVGWITLDGIDCVEELEVLHWHQLKSARGEIFPSAPPFVFAKSGETPLWQTASPGDIFDVSMIEDISKRNLLSRVSNHGRQFSVRKLIIDDKGMDGSERVSHFIIDAMDGSERVSHSSRRTSPPPSPTKNE